MSLPEAATVILTCELPASRSALAISRSSGDQQSPRTQSLSRRPVVCTITSVFGSTFTLWMETLSDVVRSALQVPSPSALPVPRQGVPSSALVHHQGDHHTRSCVRAGPTPSGGWASSTSAQCDHPTTCLLHAARHRASCVLAGPTWDRVFCALCDPICDTIEDGHHGASSTGRTPELRTDH